MAGEDSRLDARGIHVSFGGVKALSGVTLSVKRGEIFGLIGPNGAGKTTMVNVLTGFQPPTRGEVVLNGKPLGAMKPRDVARAGIARSYQAARLFRDLTAEQNVAVAGIGAGLSGRAAHAKAREILDWMNCGRIVDQHCDGLSYGDERRVSIARALALSPAYLLLDEPASGMNDSECDDLMRVIAEVPRAFGCAVLLIEHNMKVIMGVCQRVHVLDGGESLAEGTPREVQADPVVRRAYLGEKADHAELAI